MTSRLLSPWILKGCRLKSCIVRDHYAKYFATGQQVRHRRRNKEVIYARKIPSIAVASLAESIENVMLDNSTGKVDAVEKLQNLEDSVNAVKSLEQDFVVKSRRRIPNKYDDLLQKGNVEHPLEFDAFSGPDPSMPISNTPCGGCGALLHCQDAGIPGYVPSVTYKSVPASQRDVLVCQRCNLMNQHQMCLNVAVEADEYRRIVLEPLVGKRATVLLILDLTDLENSMIPQLSEQSGKDWSVVVVCNKVDMLPVSGLDALNTIRAAVRQVLTRNNIERHVVKHVAIVSAKTHFGIEKLVSVLMTKYRRGDLYILGNTNAGKSTLFNSLLSSDLCNASARQFIHRATTSLWPGTTLNLLKFPVLKASDAELWRRRRRLERQKTSDNLAALQTYKSTKEPLSLIGHIGQTFNTREQVHMTREQTDSLLRAAGGAIYSYGEQSDSAVSARSDSTTQLNPQVMLDAKIFHRSCYDTPGVVNKDQLINYLSQQELSYLLAVDAYRARTYLLKPQYTMFITGLIRIDHGHSEKSVYMTLMTSPKVPVTMVRTDQADEYYQQNLHTDKLALPIGDAVRPLPLPDMQSKQFLITGVGEHQCAADITLSSFGFVGVTAGRASQKFMEVELTVTMPGALGCHLREPPLLPHIITTKGKKNKQFNYYDHDSDVS